MNISNVGPIGYGATKNAPESWPAAATLEELARVLTRTVIQLIRNEQSRGASADRRYILDLACLGRTLAQVALADSDGLLGEFRRKELVSCLQDAQNRLGTIQDGYGKKESESNVTIISTLTSVNRVLANIPYYLAPPAAIANYGGTWILSRRHGDQRYEVGADCAIEFTDAVHEDAWHSFVSIFEHVGLKSGGDRCYDPQFFSRSLEEARAFFAPGRVFSILWSVVSWPSEIIQVVDHDGIVERFRGQFTATEGVYTGPFEGPETVRRFMVIAAGARSCLCLPILTMNSNGCADQPDQNNYSVLCNEGKAPDVAADERGVTFEAIRIPTVQGRVGIMQSKLDLLNVPHVDKLPSRDVPSHSRIDHRRVCEVEMNVRCQNVGLVDPAAIRPLALKLGAEQMKQDIASSSAAQQDTDAMDLD